MSMKDYRNPSLASFSDNELQRRLRVLGQQFDAARDGDGHGGSPGEGAYEAMSEIETELARRGARAA